MKIKQCLMIYISETTSESLEVEEICAGIEEEGVRYEITRFGFSSLGELAFNAARDSSFGCGIGVFGNEAAMQLINFKKGYYVFYISGENPQHYRTLGTNAALALKKLPFKDIVINRAVMN